MDQNVETAPPGSDQAVSAWLEAFETGLAARDIASVLALFGTECWWRDFVAFTWNLHTADGADAIRDLLDDVLDRGDPSGFHPIGTASEQDGVVLATFGFETATGRGTGVLRLRDGLCWTLLTTLTELRGFEEKRGPTRELGTVHGVDPDRRSWRERRDEENRALGDTVQPAVLIVGGGQGGLALAARLRRLEVPTLVVDTHASSGDQWRGRYKSLCLHDPVWYDHLPYLPFPDHWPVFAPKDRIADWLEAYEKTMELVIWHATRCRSAAWDERSRTWRVEVEREGDIRVLHPAHLVLATGMSGVPEIPDIPGAETFEGEQHHSSRHPGGDAWRGKRAIVIGSNNSAHDIAADLFENGADITMIQRSSTHVSRSETLMEHMFGATYSERAVARGLTAERADLLSASIPLRLSPRFQKPIADRIRAADAEFYRRLEAAGFLLDFGDDDTGLSLKYLRRGSGYYIDVGACELIADGSIKLASGRRVAAIRERSVVLDDGTELACDLIVYATGYGSMNGWAAQLISQEVADRVGKCWGYGSGTTKDPGPFEGELRNMWKPTRQDNLWFMGGNLAQARQYSLYLALQLKARHEGIETPVHRLAEVHHTA